MFRKWLVAASSLVTVVASLTITPPANAATVSWRATSGTAQMDAARAPDGSIYTVGSERRSITAAATLTKWSATGEQLWQRHWLPSVHDSTVPVAVAVGGDGTVYMLGIARGTCEGEGWFVRAYTPGGELRWKYLTPGWACRIAEAASDIDVQGDAVVVSGFSFGCCGDTVHDGWVQAFDRKLRPRWRTNVEPPTTPTSWFDTATGVAFGSSGNLYVSGWAATRGNISEGTPGPGTPFIEKLSGRGGHLWSVRARVSMPTSFLPVSIDTRGRRVDVAAGVNGQGIAWRMDPTTGWVASYSTGGVRRWQRLFGTGKQALALPTGISIDPNGRVWVESTVRDGSDRGTDVLARMWKADGTPLDTLRIDSTKRRAASGRPAALATGAVLTGWIGDHDRFNGGRVWRVAI